MQVPEALIPRLVEYEWWQLGLLVIALLWIPTLLRTVAAILLFKFVGSNFAKEALPFVLPGKARKRQARAIGKEERPGNGEH
jgi:hypothetical protein